MFARARGPASVVAQRGAQKPMSTSARRPAARTARTAVSSARPAHLLVGAGVARVEARGLDGLLDRARERRPVGGQADRVDAERLRPRDGGLDLGGGAKEEEAVVLQDRLQPARDDRGLGLLRRRRLLFAAGVDAAAGAAAQSSATASAAVVACSGRRLIGLSVTVCARRCGARGSLAGVPLDPRGRIVPQARPAGPDAAKADVHRARRRPPRPRRDGRQPRGGLLLLPDVGLDASWEPPTRVEMLLGMMQRFAHDGSWSFIGFADNLPAGHVTARPDVDENEQPRPGVTRLTHLFLRRDYWGSGLADLLYAADARQHGRARLRVGRPVDARRRRPRARVLRAPRLAADRRAGSRERPRAGAHGVRARAAGSAGRGRRSRREAAVRSGRAPVRTRRATPAVAGGARLGRGARARRRRAGRRAPARA